MEQDRRVDGEMRTIINRIDMLDADLRKLRIDFDIRREHTDLHNKNIHAIVTKLDARVEGYLLEEAKEHSHINRNMEKLHFSIDSLISGNEKLRQELAEPMEAWLTTKYSTKGAIVLKKVFLWLVPIIGAVLIGYNAMQVSVLDKILAKKPEPQEKHPK